MVDASTFVDINTSIEASAAARLPFGRGLLVSTNPALSAAGIGKVQHFGSLTAVNDVLGSASDAAEAAAVWFAADPQPQGLYIGRWATSDVSTSLTGTPSVAAGTAPLDAGTRHVSFQGSDVAVTIPASPTYANIATALQTALAAALTGTTVAYDAATGFTITLASSNPIQDGGLTAPTGSSTTDISAALGLRPDEATYVLGHNRESIGDAIDAMMGAAATGRPVAVMLAADAPLTNAGADTRDDLRAHAQASGRYVFAQLDTADQALVTGDDTSKSALAFAANQNRTAAVYGVAPQQPDVGLMAMMSAQDFNQPASIILVDGKTMPSVTAVRLTENELAELERKRVNTYAYVGDSPAALGGFVSRGGHWLDAVWWLMWLRSSIESRVWSSVTTSRRYGAALLYADLADVLELGVRNGGIQPGGTVSAATRADIRTTTGNAEFDGTLTNGYLIWIDPNPSEADRNDRIGRFRVWVTGTPAIRRVHGDIRFTN